MIGLDKDGVSIEDVLEEHGSYASVIKGVSMRPMLKTDRDVIVLQKAEACLKKYDVALYKVGEKYIFHRIIGVDKEKKIYIIRGDNTYKKEYVSFDVVLAYLTAFNRKGKHYTAEHRGYKIYSIVWNFIYPVRYFLHGCSLLLSRALRKFKGKSQKSV